MSPTSYRAAPPRGVQRNIPDPERAVNTAPLALRAALADSTSAHCCAADADGGPSIMRQVSDATAVRLTRATRLRALSGPAFRGRERAARQGHPTPGDAVGLRGLERTVTHQRPQHAP